jgi:7,8-dihydropterin-6-yl-methyl-4-(beta-D-ribofuranosyl)aminobenzene 5'-phosphate synthase
MSVEFVIVVDSAPGVEAVKAEHGLSVLVSGPGRKVLFDAGATGETLLANAEALGLDMASLDAVVISHGHCSHTGGLPAVAQLRAGLKVYAHRGAFSRRWSNQPGQPLQDVSCPHSIERLCQSGAVFHPVTNAEQLEKWLVISGPIGGPKHGRDVFVVRKGGEIVVDGFEDELCLLARGDGGWAVLTGCCHRGLKNTLRTARFLTRGEPLAALVGGLHLGKASPQEVEETADLLRQYELRDVYPCHCTGAAAVELLHQKLPGQVHPLGIGSRVIF